MAHFALSWDAHKSNICTGLSALQQSGEFVDMTIAADGHHVKVHQMIISLVSPYIKELIASANCPHPVIFLNKVSHTTLCFILEYIYTGEVLVDNENLNALIEAGKELHIKGLEDMKVEVATKQHLSQSQTMLVQQNEGQPLSETGYFIKKGNKILNVIPHSGNRPQSGNIPQFGKMETTSNTIAEVAVKESSMDNLDDTDHHSFDMETDQDTNISLETQSDTNKVPDTQIQFTISNQGALQMILNRFMYCLRYTSRKMDGNSRRQWRCVNYNRGKCQATAVTRDEVVVKRFGAHNHPFHDHRILKKVRDNAVYTAIHDAERISNKKKQERQARPTQKKKGDDITDTE